LFDQAQATIAIALPPRPRWVTERVWRRFVAVEVEQRSLAAVAREEAVTRGAVAQSVKKARAAVRAVRRAQRLPPISLPAAVGAWPD
jgi:hypothetical protein